LLEKKLKKDIDILSAVMKMAGIQSTDQTKDIMRSMITGCTSFENTFDKLIEAGRQDSKNQFPNSGKKNESDSFQTKLATEALA